MGKYVIVDGLPKVGEVYLQSGMTIKASGKEGLCDIVFGKLYIYPEQDAVAVLVNANDEIEIISEQRNTQELERRKDAVVNSQLSWRDRTSFDPSNESWSSTSQD